MSISAMAYVWKLDLPHDEKFVLLCYADSANDDGGNIFPAILTVARKTGYSKRSVQYITQKLEKRGVLTRLGKSRHSTTLFRMPMNGGANIAGAKIAPPSVLQIAPPSVLQIAPDPSLTVLNQEIAANAAPPENPERKKDLVDAYLDFQKPTETLIHAVETAFCLNVNWHTKTARQWLEWAHNEGITPDQIRAAARKWSDDKQFNWARPSLSKIFEHWPVLTGKDGIAGMTIEQRVKAMMAKSREGLPYATGGE